VDDGAEHQVIDLVMGKRNKLKLGYCIVRNRSQKELDNDSDSRTRKERSFFSTDPWSSLPKDRVGVDALKSRLQDLLSEIVQREFPKIKRQIEQRLMLCKKNLSAMGADRETSEQQRHYLEGIAAQFERITNDALSANYCRHEVFGQDHNLRLPTLVVDRSDQFAEDIKSKGHSVEFNKSTEVNITIDKKETTTALASAEDISSDDEDESYVNNESDNDNDNNNGDSEDEDEDGDKMELDPKSSEYPELMDILQLDLRISLTKECDILAWIESEYRKARGYSLEVMDPNILPMLWQEQSSNWQAITLSFMNDIIVYVHDFICRLLRHVCPDNKVRGGLLSFIMDDLLGKYGVAIKHVEFILRVERHGTLLTKNHYFGDTLSKMRNERLINAMKQHEFRAKRQDPEGALHYINAVPVSGMISALSQGNMEHAVDDIHTVLNAYYKVVMKRFIDTVVAQGADYYLLTSDESPLKILTPLFISSMTPEQLDEIAGEDLITKRERQELKEEIHALEQGRKLLRG
jgi:hypothetical protein